MSPRSAFKHGLLQHFVCLSDCAVLMSSQFNSDTLSVTIINPDLNTMPWSQSKRLQAIELVYRLSGSNAWTVAKNEEEPVTFAFAVPRV